MGRGFIVPKGFAFGLPRSRTAWLSAFLSQSGTLWHHEGVNGCYTLNEYKEKIKGFGDSTTAFRYIPQYIYLGSPVLIIEKNKTEFARCLEWCAANFGRDSRQSMIEQNDILMGITGLRVRQSEMNDNLPMIYEHLTGCEWSDKLGNIAKLNIQASIKDVDMKAARAFINEQS